MDPLAAKFPEWSPYNYTMGNPMNLVDPDGRAPGDPDDVSNIQKQVSSYIFTPILAKAEHVYKTVQNVSSSTYGYIRAEFGLSDNKGPVTPLSLGVQANSAGEVTKSGNFMVAKIADGQSSVNDIQFGIPGLITASSNGDISAQIPLNLATSVEASYDADSKTTSIGIGKTFKNILSIGLGIQFNENERSQKQAETDRELQNRIDEAAQIEF